MSSTLLPSNSVPLIALIFEVEPTAIVIIVSSRRNFLTEADLNQIQINNNLKTPFVNYFSEEQSLTKEAVLNANMESEVLKAS